MATEQIALLAAGAGLLVICVIEGLAIWGLLRRVEKVEELVREFGKIEKRVEATELKLGI